MRLQNNIIEFCNDLSLRNENYFSVITKYENSASFGRHLVSVFLEPLLQHTLNLNHKMGSLIGSRDSSILHI